MNNIATTIANHSTSKEALGQARQWGNQGLGQIERALEDLGPIHAGLENEQDKKARVAGACYAHMVSVLLNLAALERVRGFPSVNLHSTDRSGDSLMGSQRWPERIFRKHWILPHGKDLRPVSRRPKSIWKIWKLIVRFPCGEAPVLRSRRSLYGVGYDIIISIHQLRS